MKKPIIGVSGSFLIDEGGMFPGYRRCYINEDYIRVIEKNNGVPLMIPMSLHEDVIEQSIDNIDALVLSGGHDISPQNYQEEPEQKLGATSPERDRFDLLLIKYAKKKQIPILGICRGFQMLTVYHGGTLYQDLSYRTEKTLKHFQGHSPEQATHIINLSEYSLLREIFQEETLRVNSFHHQILKELPENFEVSAIAKDGVVEAIESKEDFIIGVQWHPEMLRNSRPEMNKLFISFINDAGQRAALSR